jgi:hypothetical protein
MYQSAVAATHTRSHTSTCPVSSVKALYLYSSSTLNCGWCESQLGYIYELTRHAVDTKFRNNESFMESGGIEL